MNDRSERLKRYWQQVRSGERQPPKRDPNAPKTFRVRCNSHQVRGRELLLTVYLHGEIGLREVRRRGEYKLSLAECFRMAINIAVNKQVARVKVLRKEGLTLAQARRQARKEVVL